MRRKIRTATLATTVPLIIVTMSGCSSETNQTAAPASPAATCEATGPVVDLGQGYTDPIATFTLITSDDENERSQIRIMASGFPAGTLQSTSTTVFIGPQGTAPKFHVDPVGSEPAPIENAAVTVKVTQGQPVVQDLPPGSTGWVRWTRRRRSPSRHVGTTRSPTPSPAERSHRATAVTGSRA